MVTAKNFKNRGNYDELLFSLLLAASMAWLPAAQAQQPLSSQPRKASKNMEGSNEYLEFEKNKTTLQKMISFPNDKIKAINLLAIESHTVDDLRFDKTDFAYYKQKNNPVGWKVSHGGSEVRGWFHIENEKINNIFDAIKNLSVSPRNNEYYVWLGAMIEIEYFNRKPIYIIIGEEGSFTQQYSVAEIDGVSDKPMRITIPLKDVRDLFYSIDNTHILFSYYDKEN